MKKGANNNKRKKPLIVWGARQVGKTYLVQEIFAKTYYKDKYIYIDCKKEDNIREFCSRTANAEKIIEYISLNKGKPIDESTLLIFDEVQECPNIISSLKYFCQDFREIPVIATGLMVRIKLQRETHKRGVEDNDKFLFPVGKINQITIYRGRNLFYQSIRIYQKPLRNCKNHLRRIRYRRK